MEKLFFEVAEGGANLGAVANGGGAMVSRKTFLRIACILLLAFLMRIDAFSQVDIRDDRGRIVGRLDGNDIRDDRGRIIGRIDGNDIRDDRGRIIGRVNNGTPVQVRTVALLCFFFFRLI